MEFLEEYVGLNINKMDVPLWFHERIADFYPMKQEIRRKLNKKDRMYTYETIKKRLSILNNFYYIPDEAFQVPEWQYGYLPLGGEQNPLSDSKFEEIPAKWTGNGSIWHSPILTTGTKP